MRNWIRRIMAGRYGPDQLYLAMFAGAAVLCIVGAVVGRSAAGIVIEACGYGLLVWALVRMFSRNIPARQRENAKFLKIWQPAGTRISGLVLRIRDSRTHRFFRCPGCSNLLRVPRKKGKIEITCPRCGERFNRKT